MKSLSVGLGITVLLAGGLILVYRSSLPCQVPTPLRTLSTLGIADTVRFSPDGKTLAVVTEPNTQFQSSPMHYSIELWDTATWQRRRIIPNGEFFLNFSSDSKSLFGMYVSLKQWDIASGRVLLDENGLGFPDTISADRKWVLLDKITTNRKNWLTGTTVYVWDTVKKRVRYQWKFPGSEASYNEASFSPDGTVLADVLSDHGTPEKTRLIFWDMKTGRELPSLKTLPSGVQEMAFSPDGRTFATGGPHQPIILWDRATGQQVRTLLAGYRQLLEIQFSRDGKRILALGNADKSADILVWETETGRQLLSDNGMQPIFSHHSQFLATIDNQITLWNLGTGRKIALLGDKTEHFFPGFSPDDKLLAAARERSTSVDIWAVPSL